MEKWLFLIAVLWLSVVEVNAQQAKFAPVAALSYHNIKEGKPEVYFISPQAFEAQVKTLKGSGFVSVLPQDVEDAYYKGKVLPEKAVLISFDDTRLNHYEQAAVILEKYGFRGVFFIMTVSLGKPNYMNKEQLADLSARGHAIGHHTWDHQDLRKLPADQWEKQIDRPKALLENAIGKPVTSLAYPYGAWNQQAIEEIKKRGLRSAYQLSGEADAQYPIFTLKRILVNGLWSGERLLKEIDAQFYVSKK